MESKLVGYTRKSKDGKNIEINLSKEDLFECETYKMADGHEFISLSVGLEEIHKALTNTLPVTPVVQVIDNE